MGNDTIISVKAVSIKCPQCGADFDISTDENNCYCAYCGSKLVIERLSKNREINKSNEGAFFNSASGEYKIPNKNSTQKTRSNNIKQPPRKNSFSKTFNSLVEACFPPHNAMPNNSSSGKSVFEQIEDVFKTSLSASSKAKNYPKKYLSTLIVALALVFCVIFLVILLEGSEQPDGLLINKASTDLEGEHYNDVISQLENDGFSDIKIEIIDDLITGFLVSDGEVESVIINGESSFSANDIFPYDSSVVVSYHTFPLDEDESINEAVPVNEEISTDEESENINDDNLITVDEAITNSEILEADSSDDFVSENNYEPLENITSEEANPLISDPGSASESEIIGILTAQNNSDLSALFDSYSPEFIAEFADKYRGQTIQFNGNIAHVMNYNDYDTRFNFLVFVDDYSETTSRGPSFQFRNKNYTDLGLTGDNIPEYVYTGQNYIITAKVLEYNKDNGLFQLEPISLELRE